MSGSMSQRPALRLEAKQRYQCRHCGTELPTDVCAKTHLGCDSHVDQGAGILFAPRVRAAEPCPHCGVPAGSLHHLSCPLEPCPICCEPLKLCDCPWKLLTTIDSSRDCAVCSGSGTVQGRFHDRERWWEKCPACDGTGKVAAEPWEHTYGYDPADAGLQEPG